MNYDDLVKNGQLKPEPNIKFDQTSRLLSQAKKDLEGAKEIIDKNEALALDATYKAMFHAANALIRSQGFRPGPTRQHLGIIEAVERSLGKEISELTDRFDNLRKKRNDFEYQAIFKSSRTEIENSFRDAEKFIKKIEEYIEK